MFDRLRAFDTQLYNIFGQKLVICSSSKIFDINSKKTISKRNETGFYIVMKCWHRTD